MSATKLPGLPPRVGAAPGETARVLDPMLEVLGVWKGERGDPLDRVVTLRDLRDGGIATVAVHPGRRGPASARIDPARPQRRVGPLTGLQAAGAFERVVVSWAGHNQPNYSYTEIHRATVDDLGVAVLAGTSIAPVWADSDAPDGDLYYWVRAVSTTGQAGAFNAVAGTYAATAQSPEVVRDALTARAWAADTAYYLGQVVRPDPAVTIDGEPVSFQAQGTGISGAAEPDWQTVSQLGATIADGTLTWAAVHANAAPFITGVVNGEPVVYMPGAVLEDLSVTNAKIKELAADKIFAATGTLAEAIIGTGHITIAMIEEVIQSSNYQAGVAGWRITKSGSMDLNDITARGNITADSLDANALSIVDTLHIAGNAVTIPASSYIASQKSAGSWSTGWDWTTMVSVGHNPTGSPVTILLSLVVIVHVDEATEGTPNPTATGRYRVYRNDDTLLRQDVALFAHAEGESVYSTFTLALRDDPPLSNTGYYVQTQCDAEQRFLFVQEVKR